MKRILLFTIVALLFFATGSMFAQTDPFVGTWKLNLEKSIYNPGPPPKSQTRTCKPSGNGVSVLVEGVDASGKSRTYGFPLEYDGKDYPTTGEQPNGAETISTKRIDSNTVEATFKKSGKVIQTSVFEVSKDGKTFTITAKGTDRHNVTVWDKQ